MTEKCANIKLSQEELRKLQLIQIDMLLEFDRICNKYNIPYIMDAGTLLGAVRHKGFIPWDDDIDIRMLRSDYIRFCKVVKNELDEHLYYFQNDKTEKNYLWGYAKIRRVGTEFIRTGQEHLKMKTGVFIDIFPCDGVPDNKVLKKIHNSIALASRKISYARVGKKVEKNIRIRFLYQLLCFIPNKISLFLIEFLSRICNEKNHDLVGCIAWYGEKDKNGFEKEWFKNRCKVDFEGNKYQAPKDYHGFLVHSFGEDYMTPPPVAKRVGSALATSIKLID